MQLTIGRLANQAEVTIETIRYYQQIGLLEEPEKPRSGYRHYPPEAITRIRFIKRAQHAGFTLKEIAELLSLGTSHCADVRKMAERKCQQIDAQIKDLMALRQVLVTLVKGCQTNSSAEHCSLIDVLATARDGGSVAIGQEPMRPTARDGDRDSSRQSSAFPPSMEAGSVAIGQEPMRPGQNPEYSKIK